VYFNISVQAHSVQRLRQLQKPWQIQDADAWLSGECTHLSSGEGVLLEDDFGTKGRALPVGSTALGARKKVLKNFWSKNLP
jgi:hypothetical protein